jgi:uncharacterized protein
VKKWLWFLFVGSLTWQPLVLIARGPADSPRFPDPPSEGGFVLDLARVITPAAQKQMQEQCNRLLRDTETPLMVVTIQSLAKQNAAGLSIDGYAGRLFNYWGRDKHRLHGTKWNKGILILLSRGDRKVRIQLGRDWGRRYSRACETIINEIMVPVLKKGDESGGLLAGVRALDELAREAAHNRSK